MRGLYIDIHNTERKYSIIYADPPWSYNDKKCNGAAAAHYSVMAIEDICALPVANLAADDCVLFLWIATKGKPQRASNSVGQIIEHPLGRHSAKPPQTRDKIMELMGGGAAIELFARSSAAGWDVWGDHAPEGEESQPETSFLPGAKQARADAAQVTLFNKEATQA